MAPWLPRVRLCPQTSCFSLTMSVESKKYKKVFTPSDVLFSTEKYWWRANKKKKSVSRSRLSSERCHAPLLSSQCATYGACATDWPPLIYTYDLPSTISQKYAYADDLALMHTSKDWKTLKGTLSQDMTTLSAYLLTWRLKLSHTKTVTTAFHLNNREAKRELKIFNNGKLLPYCPTPTLV